MLAQEKVWPIVENKLVLRSDERRTKNMIQINKILFPIDLTSNSAKVLPYAISLSEKYGGELSFLHVVEDLGRWSGGFYIPHLPLEKYREDALKGAEKALDQICEERLRNFRNFRKKIVYGSPEEEILKAIETEESDLVVMGTHGRQGLESVIFGSVARNIVRKSPVPVLTVNPYKVK